jgi:hypothetical protein
MHFTNEAASRKGVRTTAQRVFCSLTAEDSKRALADYQHAVVKVGISSFTRILLITRFRVRRNFRWQSKAQTLIFSNLVDQHLSAIYFDGVRGADEGIKPGVERSETPGRQTQKSCRAREAADRGRDCENTIR